MSFDMIGRLGPGITREMFQQAEQGDRFIGSDNEEFLVVMVFDTSLGRLLALSYAGGEPQFYFMHPERGIVNLATRKRAGCLGHCTSH